MRVVDYIFKFLQKQGVNEVFSVTGGGAMFLNDAMAKVEGLNNVFSHHEQASAMSALAYAKVTGKFGVVCVTTGCGGTNAMTGLLDAWQDSTPVIFISGQCKIADLTTSQKYPSRQIGVQEVNIIELVRPLTKFARQITSAEQIVEMMEQAFTSAVSGRPGPVWIDVPLDIQSKEINIDEIKKVSLSFQDRSIDVSAFVKALSEAKRPLILAGNGIHLSQTQQSLKFLIDQYRIPVVSTFLGIDLVEASHPLMLGPVGIKGVRSANFAMQNADLLICLGTRLSIPVTGYSASDFAPKAKVLVVDIDADEHKKTTARADIFVHADLRDFFASIRQAKLSVNIDSEWHKRIGVWRDKWSIFNEPHKEETGKINIYSFLKELTNKADENSIFVSDAGSAYYCASQALQMKSGQRYVASGAQADMGFTLPACMGAAVTDKNRTIWGITGDGSIMTNLQEMFTAKGYGMNIKLVILNNNGYLSIKATQKKFFPGEYVGTDNSNGVYIPDFGVLCEALQIPYYKVLDQKSATTSIQAAQSFNGFCVVDVICPEFQEVIPTLSSKRDGQGKLVSRPMHDMYPFLSEQELAENLF